MTENETLEIIKYTKEIIPKSNYAGIEALDIVISIIKEVQQYREIGTVEECQEAVEKQKPKKTKELDIEYGYFICGNCGGAIAYTDDFTSHKYCLNCGQAIQWKNLEGMEDE